MKSESIRKNLNSTVVVSWTELSSREDGWEEFGSTELADAIIFAREIAETKKDSIAYLDVELQITNESENEKGNNVVFHQSIPYNI